MQVEFVTQQVAKSILKHDIDCGLARRLEHETRQVKSDARRFGCRLCGQDSKGRFVFDGLKSHVKAKYVICIKSGQPKLSSEQCRHDIETLRDEDLFQVGKK
jgi:hypothetical protein